MCLQQQPTEHPGNKETVEMVWTSLNGGWTTIAHLHPHDYST